MRQHGPLGPPGRAGSVELHGNIIDRDRRGRIGFRLDVAPGDEAARSAILHLDHARRRLKLAKRGQGSIAQLRPDKDQRSPAIGNDICHLRRREPPSDGQCDGAHFRRAEEQLEIEVRVLADIGDTVALLHARGDQGVGDLVGVAVKLGEAGIAPLESEPDRLRARFCVEPGNIAQCLHLIEISRRQSLAHGFLLIFINIFLSANWWPSQLPEEFYPGGRPSRRVVLCRHVVRILPQERPIANLLNLLG